MSSDKPDPPANLASISKTWESVNLRWEPGFNGGFEQTFFVHINSGNEERDEEVYPHGSYTFNVTRKSVILCSPGKSLCLFPVRY